MWGARQKGSVWEQESDGEAINGPGWLQRGCQGLGSRCVRDSLPD